MSDSATSITSSTQLSEHARQHMASVAGAIRGMFSSPKSDNQHMCITAAVRSLQLRKDPRVWAATDMDAMPRVHLLHTYNNLKNNRALEAFANAVEGESTEAFVDRLFTVENAPGFSTDALERIRKHLKSIACGNAIVDANVRKANALPPLAESKLAELRKWNAEEYAVSGMSDEECCGNLHGRCARPSATDDAESSSSSDSDSDSDGESSSDSDHENRLALPLLSTITTDDPAVDSISIDALELDLSLRDEQLEDLMREADALSKEMATAEEAPVHLAVRLTQNEHEWVDIHSHVPTHVHKATNQAVVVRWTPRGDRPWQSEPSHMFAGMMVDKMFHCKVHGHMGCVTCRDHVTDRRLVNLACAIAAPHMISPLDVQDALAFNSKSLKSSPHILYCSNKQAERMLIGHPDTDNILFRSKGVIDLQVHEHLRHQGEALLLAWVLRGKRPANYEQALLLSFATKQMVACIERPGLEYAHGGMMRVTGGDYWESLRSGYESAKEYLSSLVPDEQQRARISERLKEYARTATEQASRAYASVKNAAGRLSASVRPAYERTKEALARGYDATKQSVQNAYSSTKESAQRLYNKTADAAKYGYNAAKEYGSRAWEKTRDTARRMLEAAKQARQWLVTHLNQTLERIRTDPRWSTLSAKMNALQQEAAESGKQFWNYVKEKIKRDGGVETRETLRETSNAMKEVLASSGGSEKEKQDLRDGIERLRAELDSPDVQQPPPVPPRDDDIGITADELDYKDLVRPLLNLREERNRAILEQQTLDAKLGVRTTPPPPVPVSEPVVVEEVDAGTTEPLPPPLPPKDVLPTQWSDDPDEAERDRQVNERDLSQLLAGVGYYLAGVKSTEYYNPASVSSTLSLLELVRHDAMGSAELPKHPHQNRVYRLMSEEFGNDDPEMLLARNQTIQEMLSLVQQVISYGAYESRVMGYGKHQNYAHVITDMINRQRITKDQVEDLMGFLDALAEQELAMRALHSPVRVAGGAQAHTDTPPLLAVSRSLGRACYDGACEIPRRQAFAMKLDAAQRHQAGACVLPQASDEDDLIPLCYASSAYPRTLTRMAHFRNTDYSPDDLRREHMLNRAADVLRRFATHMQELEHSGQPTEALDLAHFVLNDGHGTPAEDQAVLRFFGWLHAAGAMLLQCASLCDTVVEDSAVGARTMFRLWVLVVRPMLEEAARLHTTRELESHEPLEMRDLDQALETVIKDNERELLTNGLFASSEQLRASLCYFFGRVDPYACEWHDDVSAPSLLLRLHQSLLSHAVQQHMHRYGHAHHKDNVHMHHLCKGLERAWYLREQLYCYPHLVRSAHNDYLAAYMVFGLSVIRANHTGWASYMLLRTECIMGNLGPEDVQPYVEEMHEDATEQNTGAPAPVWNPELALTMEPLDDSTSKALVLVQQPTAVNPKHINVHHMTPMQRWLIEAELGGCRSWDEAGALLQACGIAGKLV